jgi:hypothetical protein
MYMERIMKGIRRADHTSRCIERHPTINTSSRKFLLTLRTKRSEYGMTDGDADLDTKLLV